MATAVAPHHEAHPGGITRWLFSTNHKDIGTLYLWLSFIMWLVAGGMALIVRSELFMPGLQVTEPHLYNQLITLHGLIMIFGVVMPAFVGLANWQIPLMIGAPDMALPRMNNWSFWILPFAFTLLLATTFFQDRGGGPATGWTLYPPLSIQGGIGVDFTILSIHMMGVSSILGAINVIATVINMRAPGMALMRMPLFVWTWLITAFLIIGVMPVLAGAVTMLLTDRHFGTAFFNAGGGGDPLMYQHIFWFFGHPEVYILILPAFGIISQVIPTFSRKPLFGYNSMVYAVASIAFLSHVVWAHHMFTAGMLLASEIYFMYATMLIAVPTGVKIFNWIATMWRGALTFETPMLFAIAFVLLFTIGGLSGLMVAIVPADFQYHDSYFVVAHFHYVLVTGAVVAIFAAAYYWLPKWTGHMYNERLGKLHFWLTMIGMNLTFFPMHFLGLAGMQRRVPDYALQFTEFNQWATVGAFIMALAHLIFMYVVFETVRGGRKAAARVWEGAQGLEWTLPSPPPYHSFTTPPKVH